MAKFTVKVNGKVEFEVEEFVERVQVLSPKGEMGVLNCGDDPLLNEIDIVLSVPDGLNRRLGDRDEIIEPREGNEPRTATLHSTSSSNETPVDEDADEDEEDEDEEDEPNQFPSL